MTNDVIKEAVAKQQSTDRKLSNENTVLGKVMTFHIGDQIYGIEIQYVTEIIEMQHITKIPHVPPYIKGIINVRSKVVPIVDIRSRFGKEEIPYNNRQGGNSLNQPHLHNHSQPQRDVRRHNRGQRR
ncbi:cheW-like protein [Eubacterium sp. CAG:786]|nr:cheW-like protein [Eubacterium sp. CAG:786]